MVAPSCDATQAGRVKDLVGVALKFGVLALAGFKVRFFDAQVPEEGDVVRPLTHRYRHPLTLHAQVCTCKAPLSRWYAHMHKCSYPML